MKLFIKLKYFVKNSFDILKRLVQSLYGSGFGCQCSNTSLIAILLEFLFKRH